MNNDETKIAPHTPDSCPLGEQLMKQEEKFNTTLEGVQKALKDGAEVMKQQSAHNDRVQEILAKLSDSIDASTGIALRAEKAALSAKEELGHFRTAVVVAGVFASLILILLGVISTRMMEDVKASITIATQTRTDFIEQRAKEDARMESVLRELGRQSATDVTSLKAIVEELKKRKGP